jgi:tetratricopeptide (TPR) repeat protein
MRYLYILLAALLLLSCGGERDYQALANLYAQPYPSPKRALSKVDNFPFNEGLTAYQKQQFREATTYFAQVPRESEEFLMARYYLGISLFALGQYVSASEPLKEATQHPDWKWQEPAQWYLALSLVAQDMPDPACAWLDPDNYHPGTWYEPKATELHRRICP